MIPTKTKPDTLAYLLGGVALLVISVLPIITMAINEVQLGGKLIVIAYWLLGTGAIWWATRRFTRLGERLAALVGVVVGWYILLQILWFLVNIFPFRF